MSGARPVLSLIVAVAENGVIGRDGGMPWHLPDDLKRFKALTMGKTLLMGRKTFESIGRALPGRTSVVMTRASDWTARGAVVVRSLEEALEVAKDAAELIVIGGEEIYRLALARVERIYLTRVRASVEGDTVFPDFDAAEWRETERQEHPPDARHAYGMSFRVLERRAPVRE